MGGGGGGGEEDELLSKNITRVCSVLFGVMLNFIPTSILSFCLDFEITRIPENSRFVSLV